MATKTKNRKGPILRTVIKAVLVGAVAFHLVLAAAVSSASELLSIKKEAKNEPEDILKDIYKEVKELGKRENETFIKREFHFDLDENPTNTEEHIVVLIYEMDDKERIVIQVTYFESEGFRDSIKYAKEIKLISCFLKSDELEIDKSDYDRKEIKKILPDILKGIKEEKELYKLIERKH
ncbi:MAG: hypothetical protein OEY25_13635 [Candidatus Aminicenantes bacterium]|nr:hypothetical protein [Candidatus Aminicenantes bacterium]MDH5706960.1 hypothetical protein [Candidatus Aminicenantes bacterium]